MVDRLEAASHPRRDHLQGRVDCPQSSTFGSRETFRPTTATRKPSSPPGQNPETARKVVHWELVEDASNGHGKVHRLFGWLYGQVVKHIRHPGIGGLYGTVIPLDLGMTPPDGSPGPSTKRKFMNNFTMGGLGRGDNRFVTGKIKIIDDEPVAEGGYCEVFRGELRSKSKKEIVALKRLKMWNTPETEREMFRRETNAWTKLRHSHILPFYGTCSYKKRYMFMVSPWAPNGTLLQYLAADPMADRQELLVQVANALNYLHNDCKIVHGDVKAENVLISERGDAMLADFGLSTHLEKLPGATATPQNIRTAGSFRFLAPELLLGADTEDRKPVGSIKTRESDIYAFGMVIIQAFTEERPWGKMTTARVYATVMQGGKPSKPEGIAVVRGLNASIWRLVDQCLEFDPNARPGMRQIASSLARGPPIPVSVVDLSKEITVIGEFPVRGDALSDIWIGQLGSGPHGAEKVSLAMPRSHMPMKAHTRFRREVQILQRINHPNIVPFYGTAELGSRWFIVTPFMENGDIMQYLGNNPHADRRKLLRQTAEALWHLHSGLAIDAGPVIHGSIQPSSILISSLGDAQLADIGLSRLLDDISGRSNSTASVPYGNARFLAPELLHSDLGVTLESDVYAFAMTVFMVLCGQVPFSELRAAAVIMAISRGERPQRPQGGGSINGIDDATWLLITDCWSSRPADRPNMDQVRTRLAMGERTNL